MNLICTFSNPFIGPIKSSVQLQLDPGQQLGIKDIQVVWGSMYKCELIKETSFGCYKESDKHLVFVWKDTDVHW